MGKVKTTPNVPQHLQRAFMESAVDASEAYEVGREVMRAILAGEEQVSVVLQQEPGCDKYMMNTVRVPLSEIAGKTRNVEDKYIDGIRGPTQLFVDHFLPTIGGVSALPHYPELDMGRVVRGERYEI